VATRVSARTLAVREHAIRQGFGEERQRPERVRHSYPLPGRALSSPTRQDSQAAQIGTPYSTAPRVELAN